MNMKMNTDFLKNISIPPIQLPKVPKLKTRKIFTATSKDVVTVESGGPKPKPLVISPAKISTISSLVDGAPTYDYSFGGATVPERIIDKIVEEEELTQSKSKRQSDKSSAGKLSKRISKQYRELSEFKLKDIFGKKTVVKTTEIHHDVYVQGNENGEKTARNRFFFKRSDYSEDHDTEIQESSDKYCEEVCSMVPEKATQSRRRQFSKESSEESSGPPKKLFPKAASLQTLSSIKPNDSSLWKLKKAKSKSSVNTNENTTTSTDSKQREEKSERRGRFGRRSLSRQDLDAAFDKAKKSVNSKFQQLKFMHSRNLGSKDSDKSVKKPTPTVEVIDRSGSFDSFDSEKELPEADPAALREEWLARKMLASSIESDDIPPCLLGLQVEGSFEDVEEVAQMNAVSRAPSMILSDYQSSIEEIEEIKTAPPVAIFSRPAPPIPQMLPEVPPRTAPSQQDWVPNNQIIVAFYQSSSASSSGRKSIFPEFPKGHTRKPSMDSTDSDSWIPEKLRGMTRSQIGFDKIHESSDAWNVNLQESRPKLLKHRSIDIFRQEDDEAFGDFEKALQNVPVITIRNENFVSNDYFFDQRSVDFSTDDEEDDIEPDATTIVELPHDIGISDFNEGQMNQDESEIEKSPTVRICVERIREVPIIVETQPTPEHPVDTENEKEFNLPKLPQPVANEIKTEDSIEDVVIVQEEIQDTFSLVEDEDLPKIDPTPNVEQQSLDSLHSTDLDFDLPKIPENLENPVKEKNETLTVIDLPNNVPSCAGQKRGNQHQKIVNSLVKQASLRRQYSDELDSKSLNDVSVNKLISRFEKKKSSSSVESSQDTKIIVEAIIESNNNEFDSPVSSPPPVKFGTYPHEDKNNNLKILEKFNVVETIQNHPPQTVDNVNQDNNNNNNNAKYDIRKKSIEWAKSSRSINKTLDLQDTDETTEVYYSFEDDEGIMKILNLKYCTDISFHVFPADSKRSTTTNPIQKTVRHVYNAVL